MNDQKEVSLTFKNTVTGEKDLEKYEKQLTTIYSLISGLKGNTGALAKVKVELSDVTNQTKKMNTEVEKAAKKFNKSFDTAGFVAAAKAIGTLAKNIMNLSQQSTNYIENVNLLEVAYHNSTETIEESSARIEEYIEKMSEVYNLDASDLTRKFGVFKQMANAMQLPVETGERLSELMVKMTNDVASLYNLSLERSSNALQSALVGQTRPIRGATGADITEKTLQRTVDELGLDRSIKELSYVEKRLIMVVSLTNQLKVSQGDYARTIESASNQIRIMHEQWNVLTRAVGNVFYPILEKILPYVNAILMVVSEIANIIAGLLGFKMPEFDYSTLSGVSDAALDLEENMNDTNDNIDNANKGLDTMKKKLSGLRSFDALNVINTPSSSASTSGTSGGTGSGTGSGIDPKIMEAFNKAFSGYNDMLDKVHTKASKIRDRIMEWLGFTQVTNEETGELEWKFDHITSGTVLGALIVGGAIFNGVKKIVDMLRTIGLFKFEGLGTLGSVLKFIGNKTGVIKPLQELANGFGLLFKNGTNAGMVFKNIISPAFSSLTDILAPLVVIVGSIVIYIKELVTSKEVAKQIDRLKSSFSNLKKSLDGFEEYFEVLFQIFDIFLKFPVYVIEGIVEALSALAELNLTLFIGGLASALEVLDALVNFNFSDFWGSMQNLGEALMSWPETIISSVGQLGSRLLGIIGIEIEKGTPTVLEKGQKLADALIQQQNDVKNHIIDAINMSETETLSLIDALGTLIDSNGKVNKSNQDKAKIIAEQLSKATGHQITLENDQIKIDGQVIKNQKELAKQADILIAKRKIELLLEADKDKYIEALRKQKDLQDKVSKAEQVYKDSLNDTSEAGKKRSELLKTAYDKALEEQKANKDTMTKYEELMAASYETNVGKMDSATKKYLGYTNDYKDKGVKTFEEMNKAAENAGIKIPDFIKNGYARIDWNAIQKGVNSKAASIHPEVKVTPTINKPTDKQIDNWAVGFNTGIQKYGFNFAKLPGKAKGGMYKNGVWSDITKFASGGIPRVGQMFVAREAGPELVGKIGNGTAVMNNNQIVDSVASGVYKAVVTANKTNGGNGQGTQVFNIYLDKGQKLATYTLEQLQELATTNGKPIRIGG